MILGLAPMDWITDCAYRYITKRIFDQYNKDPENKLRLWTEFMNVNGYLINPVKVLRHMLTVPTNTPTIAQIYGGNEDSLLEAALTLEKDYSDTFAGIELNIGCPSPKVMSWWGGSAMLRDKKKTLETIQKLSKALTLPFSIKTRSGLNLQDKDVQFDFIVELSKYCSVISIHGRTLNHSHSGKVDWDFISKVKEKVGSSCNIIGNGGIKTFEDHAAYCWKLDGTMTGQSAIWNPWIFTGEKPPLEELKYWILEHLHTMMACELFFDEQTTQSCDNFILEMFPEAKISHYIKKAICMTERKFFSVIEFRKFLFNYVKGIPGSKEFKVKVSRINDYATLRSEIENFL